MRLRLREIRERKYLTQQELADLIGTTKANISRIERNLQRPYPSTIRRLAEALDVSPEELVDWEGEKPDPETEQGKAAA